MSTLREDLAGLLNKHSAENGSNTPDFILASFLMTCLTAFDLASKAREKWYGRKDSPGGVDTAPEPCQHEWVDASNEVVKNAEICTKCKVLRSTGDENENNYIRLVPPEEEKG